MPKPVYLDAAATSSPKAPGVADAMTRSVSHLCAAPGRGHYAAAQEMGRTIQQTRQQILTLLNAPGNPEQVIFGLNGTDVLNIAIKSTVLHALDNGATRPRVICTAMDHNSVLRPLHTMDQRGWIERVVIPCDSTTGKLDPTQLIDALDDNTSLVVVNHCSNVCGTLQPLDEIGNACRKRNIPFLVDAAQSLGHVKIDVSQINCDMLAAPGHKGLLGPQGTGVLWIHPEMTKRMASFREGGTGSKSEEDIHPQFLPDRFEPGCPNGPGLVGLNTALSWILSQGTDKLEQHSHMLVSRMLDGLSDLTHVTQYGSLVATERLPVFSLRVKGHSDPKQLASLLETRFNLLTRPGHHCAPLAHKTLGTHQGAGTLRLSMGSMNTCDDIDTALAGLSELGALSH